MNIVAIAVTDYIGIILLIALLISSRFRRVEDQLDLKIFSNIAILTLISCFVDFVAFYSDGKPGMAWRIICLLANSFCFIANPIFVFCWCLYVDYKLYHSLERYKKIYIYASIPAVLMLLIVIINLFLPIIFYMDSNNYYIRMPLSYFYYLVDTGYILFSIIVLSKYQKKYGKVRFFPIYLMVGPIALGCALQLLFYGVSLIWVSLAIGITAIYMSIQNEFSYLDALTGLYNRAYLFYKAETFNRYSNIGGIMIDVDYFKSINDTYGHSAGDKALIDVAKILIRSKPEDSLLIRYAGDEFMLIVYETTPERLNKIMASINEQITTYQKKHSRPYTLSLSLGSSMYDQENETLDSFFKKMDNAMYEAKEKNHKKDRA
ncbi:GGDEF domain-containing protein [Butyrivibrio sp. INlla16]|uniref:GGDEF domain-containing protein n=1 Tax=Butyrivibrio sp. INlla16 TaxID=1520807 RepID=UPI00088E5557|nr:GGDEF domain-containing protein [Butyrivibrio sp. INlla16]SDB49303.1 diguanylate cyclase (GGDEF) domain-containing protein [Butyrivibrio sp. INlla16]